VFFELTHRGDEQRCLACHAVTPADAVKFETDRDVHTAAGLKCADCHRNGLDHAIIRGYEGEAAETGRRAAASFTCRGCHLGEDLDGDHVLPGRMGAPRPAHKGLPLVHFKRLACTVCHSGTAPAGQPTRVRTSRANRLGIHGVAQWWTEAPAIFQPVFARDGNELLTPHRLLWPAEWVRLQGREVVPLRPAEVEAAAGDILRSEERAAAALNALVVALEENETPAFIAGGYVFEVNIDGRLEATPEPSGAAQGSRPAGLGWTVRRNGEVATLVGDFDPAAEDKDPNAEARIQRVLEALAPFPGRPGEPAVIVRQALYKLTDGILETVEAAPELTGGVKIGWLKEGRLEPLVNEFDLRTLTAKAGREETLTEDEVAAVLKALAEKAAADRTAESSMDADFAYVSGGRLFRLGGNGRLTSRKHAAAEPALWPLAHDVRPAQQSLGRNGCTDCHSGGSDFFFARIQGAGPLLTKAVERRGANRFMELGRPLQWFFGLSFTARPLLKILLAVCGLVIAALLIVSFMYFISRWSGMVEKR
ncbi:MAG: cytochrome c3 family protein, partial [Candidatus Aminicenantes bacterium]|nr:cytochrome c3 family protein [Candidatus Aminicenantes bacterium]